LISAIFGRGLRARALSSDIGEKKRLHDRDREDDREKRLRKLVGAVVKTMSEYRTRMDVDTFKKHVKEVLTSS